MTIKEATDELQRISEGEILGDCMLPRVDELLAIPQTENRISGNGNNEFILKTARGSFVEPSKTRERFIQRQAGSYAREEISDLQSLINNAGTAFVPTPTASSPES